MNLPAAARARVETSLGSRIASAERLSGGQIAAVWRVTLQDGRAVEIGRAHV